MHEKVFFTKINIFFLRKIYSMRRLFPFYAVILIIACGIATCIFPYPVISKYTNLTAKDVYNINNYHEGETVIYAPGKSVSVSNFNWFDTVNTMFKTYEKTRVIDIKSGLTYYVYRNGGHNHADVEPIDEANTAIFKSLYGGTWSWARRPVWVELGEGNFVAASINGYPHGKSYIENNGIDGHTCIHFLLSKTHGTKRVDEDHQNAVKYAYDHRDEIYQYIK